MQWIQGSPFYLMVGASIILFFSYYSYRFRNAPGGRFFWVLMILASFTMIFTAFELLSKSFEAKLWWRNLQQIPLLFSSLMIYAFARDYIDRKPTNMKRQLSLLSIPIIAQILLIFTNQFHHLMRSEIGLYTVGQLSEIKVTPTMLNMLFMMYNQMLAIIALIILVLNLRHRSGYYFKKNLVVLLAVGFPVLVAFLSPLLNLQFISSVAFSFFASVFILYFGLFRYQMYSIWPIAKDKIFENMKEGIVLTDRYHNIIDLNPAAEEMLSRFHPHEKKPVLWENVQSYLQELKGLTQLLSNGNEITTEMLYERNGKFEYLHLSSIPLVKTDDAISETLFVLTDITEKKLYEQELFKIATTDELTGLVNRRYFIKQLTECLTKQKQEFAPTHEGFGLILIDIDDFKQVNDLYGHLVGDKVLSSFSELLRTYDQTNRIIGRLGGEEFAIFLAPTNSKLCHDIAEHIRRQSEILKLNIAEAENIQITISIGIAFSEHASTGFEALYHQADIALYQSKAAGKNRVS
jgi:diguanylate cyclase (GGDEF)-like protein/PAS domain S-box-containing protein